MNAQYHHGDLRRTLLTFAAEMAAEGSPEAITLRGLARSAGVTHSAPIYHFGTRKQLLTALAIEGFTALGDTLAPHANDIKAMGNAYVDWALKHPGHYAIMWQPSLIEETSTDFTAARERAWALLLFAVSSANPSDSLLGHEADAHAAFALVHGLASIWLSGTLTPPDDPKRLTAMITQRLSFADL